MPNIVRRALLSAVALMTVASSSHAAVRVTGRVVDANQRGVIGAKVVLSNPSPPLRKPIPVLGATGAFSADIAFAGPKLNAEISAPSYMTTRKVVIISDGVADVGTVTLTRDTSVSVEAVTHVLTPKGEQQHLDLIVVNDRTKPVEVTSIGLDARRELESTCADPSPGIIFTLQPEGKESWTASLTSKDGAAANGKWTDAFPVVVRLETSGCGNAHLQFALPYSFSLAPAERAKIRLTLPRRISRRLPRSSRSGNPSSSPCRSRTAPPLTGYGSADAIPRERQHPPIGPAAAFA